MKTEGGGETRFLGEIYLSKRRVFLLEGFHRTNAPRRFERQPQIGSFEPLEPPQRFL